MKKKTNWAVGTDEVGRSILKWSVGHEEGTVESVDPLAQTYNFLKRLDVAGLTLEDDGQADEYDPYNTGAYQVQSRRQR